MSNATDLAEVSDTLKQGFILMLSIEYKIISSQQRDSSEIKSVSVRQNLENRSTQNFYDKSIKENVTGWPTDQY